jgi:hypothetical protein
MSTLRATNIKNPDSGSNNIVLSEGGGVVISGVTTASNVSVASSITASTFYGSGANLTGVAVNSATGNFTISSGNLILSSGNGIDFSAASNAAGMTSELLDDYEVGTFTPSLTFAGGSTGISYSEREGLYVKVGKILWVQITISLSSKGSSSGNAELSLPFTVENVSGNRGGGSFQVVNNMASINGLPSFYGSQNNSIAELYQMSGTPGSQVGVANLTNSNFNNNTSFRVCGTFRVS